MALAARQAHLTEDTCVSKMINDKIYVQSVQGRLVSAGANTARLMQQASSRFVIPVSYGRREASYEMSRTTSTMPPSLFPLPQL
jgi:hypothetical protein